MTDKIVSRTIKGGVPTLVVKNKNGMRRNVSGKYGDDSEQKKTRQIVRSELKLLDKHLYQPHINQFLAALALPKDYVVPRLGGAMGSDPTALANPWSRFDVTWPAAPLPPEMDGQCYTAFAFRDPCRFLVHPYKGTTSYYKATFSWIITQGVEVYPEYRDCVDDAGTGMHGPILYPGRVAPGDQHRGWILSSGDHMIVALSAVAFPSGSYALVTIKRAVAGQWCPVKQFQCPAGAGARDYDYTAEFTGYYAVTFQLVTATFAGTTINTSGVVNLIYANGQTSWAHKALPFFSESRELADALRITGVGLCYTNQSAPINRQGQVTCLQCPKGTTWQDFLDYSSIGSDKKSVTRDVTNGSYGFLKPTSIDDLKMRVPCLPADPTGEDYQQYCFDIYPDSDYLCTHVVIKDVNGRSGYVTAAASIEYTTLNQWIEVRGGKITEQEMFQVLELLSRMPQWHENGLHWDDIWSWIKETAKDVWNGIKEIAPIAAAAAPLLL